MFESNFQLFSIHFFCFGVLLPPPPPSSLAPPKNTPFSSSFRNLTSFEFRIYPGFLCLFSPFMLIDPLNVLRQFSLRPNFHSQPLATRSNYFCNRSRARVNCSEVALLGIADQPALFATLPCGSCSCICEATWETEIARERKE